MKNDADLLEDSERLMSKFQMIEENIIKIMDKKYLIELEKEKLEKDYKIENEVHLILKMTFVNNRIWRIEKSLLKMNIIYL